VPDLGHLPAKKRERNNEISTFICSMQTRKEGIALNQGLLIGLWIVAVSNGGYRAKLDRAIGKETTEETNK